MRDRLTLAPRSRALEALDFRDGAVFDPATGGFVARTGHRYTWSRGASPLAGVAAVGGTYTAPATVPGYAAAGGGLGLELGLNDLMRGPVVGWLPQALSGELRFLERGARTSANATLFAVATDDVSGARLFLDTSGTFYRLTAHNGSATVTATLTAGQPTAGQLVRLRFAWTAGGLTLRQSINGAADTLATAGALALPAAWSAGTRVRVGRRGATANPAALCLLGFHLTPGVLDDTGFDEAW